MVNHVNEHLSEHHRLPSVKKGKNDNIFFCLNEHLFNLGDDQFSMDM
jgi:hypothetical protein